ncbi:MAG: cytochrome b/b6 domain-containing protein, partial [Candidatus Latescibacterota bacterium]
TTLVITGFALKFPDAWWVKPLTWLGMAETTRRWVHRIAGVVMLVQSVVYLGYLLFHRAGRRDLVAMLPRLTDVRDLRTNVLYRLGRAPAEPLFARYTYVEKAEFWAVVWGTVIMGASGLTLWFPEVATRFLPGLVVSLAEIVHYYEAWLATLAIVVWHFFYVILYPGEYPVNLTVFDGRITEESLAAHHPLEYQEIKAAEEKGAGAAPRA